jgi:hypothetical protein
MLHPVINQIGVDTQKWLLKKKKDCVMTTVLMDKSFRSKEKKIFKNIPYRWTTVGSMDHLDAAKLENSRLQNFSVPDNAVLVVAETLTQLN